MAEKKESVETTVRTIRRVTRKKYSAEEKVRIVLEGLRGETSVAALCRREGIPSYLYSRRTPRSPPPGMLREPASPGPTGLDGRDGVPVVPEGPAGRGEGAGATAVEAPAVLEPVARAGARPDRPAGASPAGAVGPATGLALYGPGRLLRLGIRRIPASQALWPGRKPGLPAGHRRRQVRPPPPAG